MGVKVKGVSQAVKTINRIANTIDGKKALRAVYSALYIVGAESATMVPIDTSTLLNSQFRDVNVNGTRITGKVGYSAKYAASVHEAPGKHLGKKTPRPVDKGQAPGSRGSIWDRTGEPEFLKKAGERTTIQVDTVVKKEMSL